MHMDMNLRLAAELVKVARMVVALNPVNSRGEFDKYYDFYLNSKCIVDSVKRMNELLNGLDIDNYSDRISDIESCINDLSQTNVDELGTKSAIEEYRKFVNELKRKHAEALRDNLSSVRNEVAREGADDDDDLDGLDDELDELDEDNDDEDDEDNEDNEDEDEKDEDGIGGEFNSIVNQMRNYSESYLDSCLEAFKSRYSTNAKDIRSLLDTAMDIGHDLLGPNANV